jgi:hypothetical protein
MNPIILDSNLVRTVITNRNDTLLIVFNQYSNSSHSSQNSLFLLIPIIATIIGGVIALFQVRGNTISSARITWIENFRIAISEYCVEIQNAILIMQNSLDRIRTEGPRYIQADRIIDYNKYVDSHRKAKILAIKIKLYLHSKEIEHKEIEKEIDRHESIVEFKNISNINLVDFENDINKIIVNSKIIIKTEWEKAKSYFPKIK